MTSPIPAPTPVGDDRVDVAAEAYQVIGSLAFAAGLTGHPEVQRALDYFSAEHQDGRFLPFVVDDVAPAPVGGASENLLERAKWAIECANYETATLIQDLLAAAAKAPAPNGWRVLERATDLDFNEALTIQWQDGSETVEKASQRVADILCDHAPVGGASAPDAPVDVKSALDRALRAMRSVTVFVTTKERIKRPEGEDWWQDELDALAAVLGDRSFPEAADGRPSSDTEAELFGAGCDPETARFVARQLEQKGVVLTRSPAPDADVIAALRPTRDWQSFYIAEAEGKWLVATNKAPYLCVEGNTPEEAFTKAMRGLALARAALSRLEAQPSSGSSVSDKTACLSPGAVSDTQSPSPAAETAPDAALRPFVQALQWPMTDARDDDVVHCEWVRPGPDGGAKLGSFGLLVRDFRALANLTAALEGGAE